MRRCVVAAAPKKLSDDQIRGLQLVCSGRDGLVLLRTGGGKTLLWQLPASLDGGLTVVVVPSVALALDLKESTDKFFAGKSLFCCHDLRSEGERGEAVESTTVPSAAAAPSAPQAADRIGMAWAAHARPWQCGECAGCTSKRFRCTFKCGTCSNCTKKKGCLERREREDAWATAEATRAAAAAAATDVTDVTDATVAAAGTPTPATGGNAGGRTRSRIAGLDEAATEPDERPVTEAEVRDARRVGTASHAALCDASVAVIITTPEGVAGEYRESQRLRLALERCGRLRRVVIDEAHCRLLSSHGSFRPAYAALGGFLGYLSDAYRIQVLGFSATVPPPLRPTLADDLGMRCPVDPIVGELDRPEISFATFPLPVRPRQSFASLVEEAWRVAESSAPEWENSSSRKLFSKKSLRRPLRAPRRRSGGPDAARRRVGAAVGTAPSAEASRASEPCAAGLFRMLRNDFAQSKQRRQKLPEKKNIPSVVAGWSGARLARWDSGRPRGVGTAPRRRASEPCARYFFGRLDRLCTIEATEKKTARKKTRRRRRPTRLFVARHRR